MSLLELLLAATPSPSVDPTFDANTVTPGWVGFLITFLIAVATVLLVIDMVRRIRRVRYREEIRAKILAEQDAATADPAAGDRD